ncbi:hypothetical protein [Sphingobium yanoikuyae]|jgi:hypothetical protein|uniref:hypothetical protein n=1 Tax=Sphingobium yanoikuyae TaxID=13690 RepID=UPI00241E9848|nr:hypothetical protein [Sphingobium yanoikuyae]
MKTLRKSRSVENSNARKDVIAYGGRTPLAASFRPERFLSDRRVRRVARRAGIDTAALDLIVLNEDGTFGRPTITVVMDERTRQILGCHMS